MNESDEKMRTEKQKRGTERTPETHRRDAHTLGQEPRGGGRTGGGARRGAEEQPKRSERIVMDESRRTAEAEMKKRNLEQTRVEVDEEAEEVTDVLNTAKRDELLSVPGIGKATAKRIIKHRPYQSEEEVLEEGVLPEKTLERVKEELVEHKDEKAS